MNKSDLYLTEKEKVYLDEIIYKWKFIINNRKDNNE